MPAGGRPTVRSRRLGAALKRYRQAAKLDQLAAAEVLGVDPARVSRIESGLVTARILEIRVLLNAYGEEDPEVRSKLEDLAKRSKHRGWWLEHAAHLRPDYLDHISLEDDATHIRAWAQALVPGLLQTPAYAEAVITSGPNYVAPERVAQLVKVREARQAKIEEGGAAYTAIVWEPVIIHPLVRVGIHQEQLANILEVGRRRNVTVQVLPLSAGTLAGEISAFASFSFDAEPVVEAVTLENLRGTSILEAPEDLAAYTLAFDQLRSAALAPDASAQLIQRARERIKDDAS
ncbi:MULTISPECIES: helix-turn-helix domain-containing protein [Streptomyces]|uniref:Helix-turn-helix transcriptional regulator n=2 Tax=Streptomyces TaxID=1883 RepID=A0ABU4MIT0_9ACTN|nr:MULTISPECIES: helix-turn-helix transcriptional regulator [Streptomyces]MBE4735219.1 helix-turn-helix domain-containing protein [Streptomyces caniscabiei]MBE4754353.1 helix-turn-helix domain-containing protein [Streptomyces caniscabiei]MBE4767945.1 helix-turn-helix domain-containing protein [Streptomyces caniscabiei]MBE4784401.1 helix-turn-helix domain-containing protein [Streptomyces caniscabiei]MBE4791100.1 helix-turn-helix domain-containing protein [Streptomyces caniscabiei]